MSLVSRSSVDNTKKMIISFMKESKGSTWEDMMIDTYYSDFCKDSSKKFSVSSIISLLKGKMDIDTMKFLMESSLGSSWAEEMCVTWYGEFDIEGKVYFNVSTILLCVG